VCGSCPGYTGLSLSAPSPPCSSLPFAAGGAPGHPRFVRDPLRRATRTPRRHAFTASVPRPPVKRKMWRRDGSQRTHGRCAGGTGETVEQRRGLLSERPLPGGPSRSHEGPSEEDPGGAHRPSRARTRTPQFATRVPRSRQKKPGHPRGAGSARAVGRTGQRAGRPGPDGGGQLHPVVSPQFSHLWQVPLRTVSQPQRGQGGASGVELSRR
jgi:hypothetical protein